MSESPSEENFDSHRLYNWIECFKVIQVSCLVKLLGNKTSFVTDNESIRMSFDLENSFSSNYLFIIMFWNKIPRLVFNLGCILNLHRFMPVVMKKSFLNSSWFMFNKINNIGLWFKNICLPTSYHGMRVTY